MSREAQQIRATAIQLALAILPYVKIEAGEEVIELAKKIAGYIEGERPALLVPKTEVRMKTVADQIKND